VGVFAEGASVNTVAAFQAAFEARKVPAALRDRVAPIDAAYEAFLDYATQGDVAIYGANTLLGHRDTEFRLQSAETEEYFLRNHAIGGPPFLSGDEVAAITLAKLFSLYHDGVTLSGRVFQAIIDCFEDRQFQVLVPEEASYSSGDVIPASHWAIGVLERAGLLHALRPGEAIGLMNGAFVHVGLTALFYMKASALLSRMVTVQLNSLQALRVSRWKIGGHGLEDEGPMADFQQAFLRHLSEQDIATRQLPVSIRSTFEQIASFRRTLMRLGDELALQIARPSGNPLFSRTLNRHFSSGSFVAPALAIQTSAVIDALLMLAWSSVERTKFLLSGPVPEMPLDAATEQDVLGMIQWPKLAQAKLEAIRHRFGSRAFVSGGTTSYGVEDFWTHGSYTSLSGLKLLDNISEIFAIELSSGLRISHISAYPNTEILAFFGHRTETAGFDDVMQRWEQLDQLDLGLNLDMNA
jgi:histidine ammonia-lyase